MSDTNMFWLVVGPFGIGNVCKCFILFIHLPYGLLLRHDLKLK